ncbi:MAG: HEAT repeat domain-containing protein [Spirochaetes bacterium]|nr:HEAT repeat domain-containing protein [Spirochaetota bacterium]
MKKIMLLTLCVMFSFVIVSDGGMAQDKAKKSAKEYIADLSSSDEATVVAAEEWIADNKEKTALPKLQELLRSDSRVKVRLYAAIALGEIAKEEGAESLNNALLNDPSADVRYAALLGIARIGSKSSYDAVQKARESEQDPFIKDLIKKMEDKFKGK